MSEVREILKAFKRRKDKDHNDLLFGTLYSGRCRVLRDERRWPIVEPDLAIDPPELPVGWECGRENDNSAFPQVFCARWFQVQHGLKFRHPRGGRMPKEILWLLSGWLQRGEFPSYRNYQRYCRLDGLKFLPLLIDHDRFRFFVFRPTVERIEAVIETFKRTVKVMTGPGSWDLIWLATRLLASLRNDELWPICFEKQDPKLLINRRHLSFVYRDLKGPQDAVCCNPS